MYRQERISCRSKQTRTRSSTGTWRAVAEAGASATAGRCPCAQPPLFVYPDEKGGHKTRTKSSQQIRNTMELSKQKLDHTRAVNEDIHGVDNIARSQPPR
jgi:hypothetical protein